MLIFFGSSSAIDRLNVLLSTIPVIRKMYGPPQIRKPFTGEGSSAKNVSGL